MRFIRIKRTVHLRINISIAIVAMAGKSENSTKSPCSHNQTSENVDDGSDETDNDTDKLGWTGSEVSWVLTAFFIGYAAFQVRNIHMII